MGLDTQNSYWNLIKELANKKGITEVAINEPHKVFVERGGQFIQLKVDLKKDDLEQFIQDVAKINGKKCNWQNPILDGILPDGSRINIILSPFVQTEAAITIRKYQRFIKSFDQENMLFGLHDKAVEFIQSLVRSRMNIMISGGTSMGKTTFLNLLLGEIDKSERVITVEDTYELSIPLENHVKMASRSDRWQEFSGLSARDLIKNALRMRPDRIIIGEVRGEEVFDLLQAMNTGHSGSMSSIHANSARECLKRIETLFLLAGFEVSLEAIRHQICMALDYIIQLSKDSEGKRIVSEILEITGMEGGVIQTQPLASYKDGRFVFSGLAPSKLDKLVNQGLLTRDFFS